MGLLKTYKSHKKVAAAKIEKVIASDDGSAVVVPVGARLSDGRINKFELITTGPGWFARVDANGPDPGYYVRYKDGYESWSPSEAFESGYKPVDEGEKEPGTSNPCAPFPNLESLFSALQSKVSPTAFDDNESPGVEVVHVGPEKSREILKTLMPVLPTEVQESIRLKLQSGGTTKHVQERQEKHTKGKASHKEWATELRRQQAVIENAKKVGRAFNLCVTDLVHLMVAGDRDPSHPAVKAELALGDFEQFLNDVRSHLSTEFTSYLFGEDREYSLWDCLSNETRRHLLDSGIFTIEDVDAPCGTDLEFDESSVTGESPSCASA